MLYESLGQPLIFLCIFATGLLSALIFDIVNLVLAFCNKNLILKQILYFFSVIFCTFALFLVNLYTNYGRFRAYVIVTFLISFAIERISLGKLWTKLIDKCYNKHKEKLKNKNEEKKN